MRRSDLIICTLLFSGLTIYGPASADGGRARGGPARAIAVEQARAAARNPESVNTVSTVQQGRGNAASAVQTGNGNTAGIRQFGRSNTGAITQTGSANTACLIQAGRNLDGAIEQVGDNQTTGVLQTRWGANEIPAEVCATATTREDVMAYVTEAPGNAYRGRGRGRGRSEP